MHVTDLTPRHHEVYFHCLEPWAEENRDGVARKRSWYATMSKRGLIVKLAIDDDGEVAGMIQSLPVEHSHVLGEKLHLILCIWVHGHKHGIGDRRGRGMGVALLEAVEAEARAAGALGMAAWGLSLPLWMRASWFRKHGYALVDRQGVATLLWKPFDATADPPAWVREPRKPNLAADGVAVTCFESGWCTLQNATCARARRVAAELGDDVVFTSIDTSDPETALLWRQSDDIYVDHEVITTGPPPSEAKIRRVILRHRDGPWWRRWWRRTSG